MVDEDKHRSQQPQPQQPRLHGSGLAASLVRRCPSFQRGFNPPPHLSGPHRQTLAGVAREFLPLSSSSLFSFLRRNTKRLKEKQSGGDGDGGGGVSWSFRRQLVHCDDGGTIALDWWEPDRRRRKRRNGTSSVSTPPPSSVSSSSSLSSSSLSSPSPLPPTAPLLLVLHGLTGGSSEAYVRSLCSHATRRGFRAAAVVYRGCGGLALTSRRAYSATFTGDVAAAARAARRAAPLAPSVSAVGFSLGAVILAKYLGEQDGGYWDERGRHHHGHGHGRRRWRKSSTTAKAAATTTTTSSSSSERESSDNDDDNESESDDDDDESDDDDDLIAAAVAVSSPFCLERAAEKIGAPWTAGWLYNVGLALRLKHYMLRHRRHIFSSSPPAGSTTSSDNGNGTNSGSGSGSAIDVRALATSYLVPHIDDAASARACGYGDRASYYSDAATGSQIPHVTRTPLLFVASRDDPFLGDGALPVAEVERNPRAALVVTERGGHCAFLDDGGEKEEEDGSPSSPSSAWVDRLACEWLALVLEEAAASAKKKRKKKKVRQGPLSRL